MQMKIQYSTFGKMTSSGSKKSFQSGFFITSLPNWKNLPPKNKSVKKIWNMRFNTFKTSQETSQIAQELHACNLNYRRNYDKVLKKKIKCRSNVIFKTFYRIQYQLQRSSSWNPNLMGSTPFSFHQIYLVYSCYNNRYQVQLLTFSNGHLRNINIFVRSLYDV